MPCIVLVQAGLAPTSRAHACLRSAAVRKPAPESESSRSSARSHCTWRGC